MEDSDKFNKEANELFSKGDAAGALEFYSKAINRYPLARYYGNRSQCYITLGKFGKAAKDAEKALELEENEFRKANEDATFIPTIKYLYRAAKGHFSNGDAVSAKVHLERMLKIEPNHTDGVNLFNLVMEAIPKDPIKERLALVDKEGSGWYRLTCGARVQALKTDRGKIEGCKSPLLNDVCQVHYHGTLLDGTVFDSSYDREVPATFRPSEVIKGWTEVLQLMREGDKWRVLLPSDIAYGKRGAGDVIPPNAMLEFVIELLKVEGKGKTEEEAMKLLKDQISITHDEMRKF